MSEPGPNVRDDSRDSPEARDSRDSLDSRARLDRARTAYAAGDFAAVHGLCASLAPAPGDPELAARAQALDARVAIDPASWIALGTCLALLIAIVVRYVG